jgi:hypothetical protein
MLREFHALEAGEREAFCRKRTTYAGEAFEDCSVTLLGNGSALLLSITLGCGGDSCDFRQWVFTPLLERPYAVETDGGVIEAAPDASFLLVDEFALDSPDPFPWTLGTVRIDLPSGRRQTFAGCFSARLSPKGHWFLCRDRAANVLRVPLAGGVPELVASSGAVPEAIEWVPYAWLYPDPVEFRSPTELVFQIAYQDGALAQTAVSWSE